MMRFLEDFVHIRKSIESETVADQKVRGQIIPTESDLLALRRLADGGRIEEYTQYVDQEEESFNFHKITSGRVINVCLLLHREPAYFETLADLYQKHPNKEPTSRFYVHEIKEFSDQGSHAEKLAGYYLILQLIDILVSMSDYQSNEFGNLRLVIFHEGKTELDIQYNSLSEFDCGVAETLVSEMSRGHDVTSKLEIFKARLTEMLVSVPIDQRMQHIIDNLEHLEEIYRNSYSLYLAEFSFGEVMARLEKTKMEYQGKLAASIGDIQTKLVAAPLAFVLVAGQFETDSTSISLKNIFLFAGALILGILLDILGRSQHDRLDATNREINRLKDEYMKPFKKGVPQSLQDSFVELEQACRRQQNRLLLVRFFTWLPVVAASVLLFWYSPVLIEASKMLGRFLLWCFQLV